MARKEMNEYGEPIRHDPTFNGPIHNRSCTDILWLILFVLFLGAWGFLGFYSISRGNMDRIVAPMDSYGRRCGLDSGLEDKKYLVFFDITKCLSPETPIMGCPTPQVCVNKCPDQTILFNTPEMFAAHRSEMICTGDVNVQSIANFQQAQEHINNHKCAKFVIKSQPVLFRCISDLSTIQCNSPTADSALMRTASDTCVRDPTKARQSLVDGATALHSYVGWIVASWMAVFTKDGRETHIISAQIVQDLTKSQWYLVGGLCVVVVICFIYILLLRWVVAPVVWTSIVGLLGLLGFSVYKCYQNYVYYEKNRVTLVQTTNIKGYFEHFFTKHEVWLALTIAVAIILVILLIIVIFLRARIVIAIALIKEGSKAVCAIKTTVVLPIFPWLLQCAVLAFGIVVLLCLMSLGESKFNVVNFNNDTCDCKGFYTKDQESCVPETFIKNCVDKNDNGPCKQALCHFSGIENSNAVMCLHLANLLGIFWTIFFISGIADMVLASTFSTWYWTFKKKDLPFFTLTSGAYRTIRYHMGTVAFGALIIAIVRVIRVILEYIDHKLKKFDNPFTRCVLCCCKCFFWCLESFLKFINKNAYIMCAVHGKNFCASARDAFSLLLRNIVRVVVLDKVTDFLFFLSKLLISIGVGFSVYYLLKVDYIYEVTNGDRLNYNYIPAIILSVATYIVSSIFFNVYAMAVDTLFLCFLEDCERNDGSVEKPYFMSKNLMKILGKRNKKE